MKEEILPYDVAENLATPFSRAVFLTDALEADDPEYLAFALGIALRSAGIAEETADLSRKALLRTLAEEEGNPSLKTLSAVLDALGLKMVINRIEAVDEQARKQA